MRGHTIGTKSGRAWPVLDMVTTARYVPASSLKGMDGKGGMFSFPGGSAGNVPAHPHQASCAQPTLGVWF